MGMYGKKTWKHTPKGYSGSGTEPQSYSPTEILGLIVIGTVFCICYCVNKLCSWLVNSISNLYSWLVDFFVNNLWSVDFF